jgi:hypothetical protein
MAKKMSLQAWINSQLKNKGMTVKQAKKNAGKYKSIAAAKKAGSLYYTNKDGKIMIAAYAEDLKMPLKRPESMEKSKLDFNKIEKKELPPPKGEAKRKIKEADKKSMDKYNYLFETDQIKKVPPKPPIRLHEGVIKRQRERKAWEKKYGDKYNNDGTLKGSKSFNKRGKSKRADMNMGGMTMKKKGKSKMNMGGMMSPTKKKPTGSATGLTGMKGGGMMKKKGYAKGGMKKKGYAMGGAMKKPAANQRGLKKLPTAVRNKMGYMAKGGAARRGR